MWNVYGNKYVNGTTINTFLSNEKKIACFFLFNDLNRFYPVLYNNLKGTITEITKTEEKITFKIRVDIFISDIDAKKVKKKVIERSEKSTII